MSSIKSYQDLIVWQKAMELVEKIYLETIRFPRTEVFGITAQMRRSAASIPSNIAEGHARNGTGEFRHFLGISKGSLAELETLIILSGKLNYLNATICESLMSKCSEVNKLINGLLRSLSK
ncbi:MAG: four helix bundle protein [Cyclobacteriaceae bacterium]|nr:four helix bundle protein [Cyclobacteriaceae bacterium]